MYLMILFILIQIIKVLREPNLNTHNIYLKQEKIVPKPAWDIIEPNMEYDDSLWMENYVSARIGEIQEKIACQNCPFVFYVGDLPEKRRDMMLEWFLTLPTTKNAYLDNETIRGTTF